ncbi:hypothetical protein [Gluconobacter cerinus]|uniref:hypothetical protein n=1 Tax=Gluconobacter cerinus TaxID=38307 RepID=UPI001B8D61BA|nr:hypothetical protein [Gluconobacter cerinus]MBS1067176.1 hypothetical protein [Gluconobacter cerinus]
MNTRYFVIQKSSLGITPETSTLVENENAIYAAILTAVNADTADTLNGAVSA